MQSLRRTIQVFSLPLIFFVLFPFTAGAGASDYGQDAGSAPRRFEKAAIVRLQGPASGSGHRKGDVLFRMTVEIVSDREAKKQGLSGREGLAEDSGMLFVLEEGRPGGFWMNGMRFPLDLLYFDREKKLIRILSGLQPCTNCPVYESPAEAAYVIEVAAGTAGKYGIRTGDFFTFTQTASEGRVL